MTGYKSFRPGAKFNPSKPTVNFKKYKLFSSAEKKNVRGGSTTQYQKSSQFDLHHTEKQITDHHGYIDIKNLSDKDLINSIYHPNNGAYIKVETSSGKVWDGIQDYTN